MFCTPYYYSGCVAGAFTHLVCYLVCNRTGGNVQRGKVRGQTPDTKCTMRHTPYTIHQTPDTRLAHKNPEHGLQVGEDTHRWSLEPVSMPSFESAAAIAHNAHRNVRMPVGDLVGDLQSTPAPHLQRAAAALRIGTACVGA